MDRGRIVVFAVLAVAIALFIAGAVMLGIGIHKANQKSDSNDCPASPTITPANYAKVSAIFASTRHTDLKWSNDLKDPSSAAFAQAATTASQAINKALAGTSFGHVFLASPVPSRCVVNRFGQDMNGGVDAYSTLMYPDDVDAATRAKIVNALNVALKGAQVYGSPLDQCNGQPFPPPNSNPATTLAPVVTTATVLPAGVYCDASTLNAAIIFLVDLAVPQYGSYDEKLSQIRAFLLNMDNWVNLPQKGLWKNVQFFIVPYYGFDAYTLGSAPVRDHASWVTAVNSINTTINYNKNDAHNLAHGLNYVVEALGKQLPVGTGRSLVVVADGLDERFTPNMTAAARTLASDLYTISTITVSRSISVTNAISSIASNPSHFYTLPDMSWLSNPAVTAQTSYWICGTSYPTQPPTTPARTPVPLLTTTTPKATTASTPIPTTTPPVNCPVDMIFLLDESQTMLWQFTDIANYMKLVTSQVKGLQPNGRYAIISFNKKVVYSTNGFVTADQLITAADNITRISDVVDYTVGFNAVRDLLKTKGRQNDTTVLPLVVFLTDGDQLNENMKDVMVITTDLRKNMRTEIMALGVNNPLPFRQQLIKDAIGVDSQDTYTKSYYIQVNTTADLKAAAVSDTVLSIQCSGNNDGGACYTDFTFIIETSYATADYQATEIDAVVSVISDFASSIGPFYGRISVIYFSATNTTATLIQTLDNAASAIYQVGIATIPVGGSSDIKSALELATTVVSTNSVGNDQLVLFFARGIYNDGSAENCCSDPAPAALKLRSKATIQGIMLSTPTNETTMAALTGQPVLNANKLITNPLASKANGRAIADKLNPIIKAHLAKAVCSGIPSYAPPCMENVDVTIAIHATKADEMQLVKDFVSKTLLPSLFGGSLSNLPLTRNSPVNLAIIASDSFKTDVYADFTQLYSPVEYSKIVQSINVSQYNYAQLSKVYNMVQTLRTSGRSYASTIVIIITDAVSPSDQIQAKNALDALGAAYAEGIQFGSSGPVMIVSGNPIVISTAAQLSPEYPRSSRALANQLAFGACKVVTTPVPPTVPMTTLKTTPAPLPRPKPRVVWPDITILVDTSYDSNSAMTDQGFQLLRQFIYRYFLDGLYISNLATRISLATFDATTKVACTYGDIDNYYDLRDCIVNKFEYNVVYPHTKTRDLIGAINVLQNTTFNVNNGFRPLKENFLLIFTTGSASADASGAIQSLQRLGVRTIGINLGANMDFDELSLYGIDSVRVSQWMDENHGINGNNLFGYHLVDKITNYHIQPLSNYYADFYFVVDFSYAMSQAGFADGVRKFVRNFANQLTIGDHRSRIAVVPYNKDIIAGSVLELTGSSSAFDTWWKNQFLYTTPTDAIANIGAAITKVQGMYQANSMNTGRVSHVIYVVVSPTATGAELSAQLQHDDVRQWALRTNPKINYTKTMTDSDKMFTTQTPIELNNWIYSVKPQNDMANFFNYLSYIQEEYRQGHEVQLAEVQADIVFAIDQTGLTNQTFEGLKNYLIDFTSRFHVSATGARFALQPFNDRNQVENGIEFKDCTDNNAVVAKIKALRYEASKNANSDLVGALIQINDQFMRPQNGWRNGPTYVIMLVSGDTFQATPQDLAEAKKILTRARTFAIGLNGAMYAFITQFVPNAQNYLTVANPGLLTKGSLPDGALSQDVQKWFEDLMYPTPPGTPDVRADFIFLIDYFSTLGADGFAQVKAYLYDLIKNRIQIAVMETRIAVVSYAYSGVLAQNTFNLNYCSSKEDCLVAVSQLTYSPHYISSDIVDAIEYVYQDSKFGYDPNRLTFVVDIASAPTATRSIPRNLSRRLNKEAFTFAYTYQNATQWDYIGDFLGDDGGDNFKGAYPFGSVDSKFQQYVIKAYQAWRGTFGN